MTYLLDVNALVALGFQGHELHDRVARWVKKGRQTTDGHLAELAKAKGAVLATLDKGIPGAFLIP